MITAQYYIYCSPIPMLQTGIGLEALRGGHKNVAHLYRAGRELTSRILLSLPTKRGTAAAYNLVYDDYIPRSIQSLVAFLPAVPGFSCSGARNLPEVKLPLIT